ncbi:MAG: amidoligase family protein [Clostridium sp.]|nr:amidoligase family protein [Clostridium sp.]
MEKNTICSRCGDVIKYGNYQTVNNEIICQDCADDFCVRCHECDELIYSTEDYGDDNISLCQSCYDDEYTRCERCNRLIHNDNSYEYGDYYYCRECYDEVCDDVINDYNYKPEPIFHGDSNRYFGVELEIDMGGKDGTNAEKILEIGNDPAEHIYIKSDGSLEDGMEIVTHPMTLNYHLHKFCWEDILCECVRLGYRSHQTSTCGLHVHVNRDSLGNSRNEQDEVISRILYFVEHHWNELLKFSRRSEETMNRWAARYGYENDPKAILDKAKKDSKGRYAAVNLQNYHTVEFRMFRGTLKLNTLTAVLQMVDKICNTAVLMSDEQIRKLSWSDFAAKITEPELVQYLKERRLYVNETIENEEDL